MMANPMDIVPYFQLQYEKQIELIRHTQTLLLVDRDELYLCPDEIDEIRTKNPLEYVRNQPTYRSLPPFFQQYIRQNYQQYQIGVVYTGLFEDIWPNNIIISVAMAESPHWPNPRIVDLFNEFFWSTIKTSSLYYSKK